MQYNPVKQYHFMVVIIAGNNERKSDNLKGCVAKKFTKWSAFSKRMLSRKFIHNLV